MEEMVDQEVTTSGIDQGSMEADYMSTYQLADESGNPIEENQIPDVVKQEQPQDVPAQQAQPENKTDDPMAEYTKGFYKDDGNLDMEKAMQLFDSKSIAQNAQPEAQPQQPQQPIMPPMQQQQPQQAVADPHEQIRENAMAALKLQRYYMSQGLDAESAMTRAEQDIDAHLRQYLLKSEMEKMKQDFEKEKAAFREEIQNEREVAKAEPMAEKNLMNTCNKFAKGLASETLRKAIFDPNIGGQFVIDLFNMQNPDKSNLVGDQLNKAMNDWFIRNAAKNERFADSLAINALNIIRQKVHPELLKIAQTQAAQRTATQQKNKQGPSTPQRAGTNKAPEQSGEAHNLDVFFHNAPRSGGRAHI